MKKWKQYDIIGVQKPSVTSETQSFDENWSFHMPAKAYAVVFVAGGLYYCFLEFLWRGYTHWTMAITAGACFLGLFFISSKGAKRPLLLLCLEGSLLITALEFIAGSIVNLLLGWHVWDYSTLRFHLLGQVSLLYSIVWFFMCIPGIKLCRILQNLLSEKA